MRIPVPLFAFLFFSAFSGVVHANSLVTSWGGFENRYECKSNDVVAAGICELAKPIFCDGAGGKSCFLPRKSIGATKGSPDKPQRVEEALKDCRETVTVAKNSCADKGPDVDFSNDVNGRTRAICEKMAADATTARTANMTIAGTCDAKKEICRTRCSNYMNEAKGIDEGDITAAIQEFEKAYGECDKLSDEKPRQMAQQLTKVIGESNVCAGKASDGGGGNQAGGGGDPAGGGDGIADPGGGAVNDGQVQSAGGMGMNPAMLQGLMGAMQQMMQPKPEEPVPPQLNCEQNPNLSICSPNAKAAAESWNDDSASLQAQGDSSGGGGFNVPDLGDSYMPQSESFNTGKIADPMTATAVPNGGGGGIPGGGGSAQLGAGGATTGSFGIKTNTDILQGERSGGGGYGQMAAGMQMKTGESGGYNYGGGGAGSGYENLNLGDYLPGGKNDPRRGLAAAGAARIGNGINSKDVNIFNRISERLKARCSAGLLRDCVP